MNILTLSVPNPTEILVGFGTGALILIESGPSDTGPFTQIASLNVVAGVNVYPYYDAAAPSTTWYRTRFSNATQTNYSDYSSAVQANTTSQSWTYSGDPAASHTDGVRFLLGDTNSADQQLRDEEIAFVLLIENDDIYRAAARGAEALAAKYARAITKKIGSAWLESEKKAQHYRDLAKQLWYSAGVGSVVPWVGSISQAVKQVQENNEDNVSPFFTRETGDYPNTMPIGTQQELTE
jgi:hypothetical protein